MSAPAFDHDAEQEIDLRTVWTRIAARWWLPALGILAGLVLGWLLALGGGQVYKAQASLFLGQPFTPNGGGQIQSLATNPRTVNEIIRSESALKGAAAKAGLRVGQLRGRVSSTAITTVGQARGVTPLVEITVKGAAPRKTEVAANALAQHVIDQVSTYVETKVSVLKTQIETDQRELDEINSRLALAQKQLTDVLADKRTALTERLLVSINLNSTIGFTEQRRGTVQEDLLAAQQLLSLAQNVEQSRIIEPAVAVKSTARSGRNAALVGALIGLLLGSIAALAADPFLARRAAA
jgi:uncharacterized protein involved in exopolysaccharide biosynthesis